MSITEGYYFIENVGRQGNFVGVGPLPPVYPPFPAPLKSVHILKKDVFEVKPMESDKYMLKTYKTCIGFDKDDNVSLLRHGQKSQSWCIEDAGEGAYRIKHPDSGKYWTFPRENNMGGAPIKLESENGLSDQEWKFAD